MKKEARIQAENIFLRANGKITNREIAKVVKVNPLTIGRWRREEGWEEKLKGKPSTTSPEKQSTGAVRKKAARDRAHQLYLEAGGNITNKELARKVDVTAATISKWKEQDNWIGQIMSTVEPEPEPQQEPEELPEEDQVEEPSLPETAAPPHLDIGDLVSPEQILLINNKIDALLKREHLSADEVADLADAKTALMEAVEIYLGVVRDVREMKSQEEG